MAGFGEDYKHFNAREFLHYCYGKEIWNKQFLNLMSAELQKGDKTGMRLLELGSGPTLYNSLLASKYYNEIIISEYAEPNRVELLKWWKQEEDAFDWSPYIHYISQLEQSEPEAVEQRTRSAIKYITSCDLNMDQPVPPYQGECFDCIISTSTIECCSTDMDTYKANIQKAVSLLVPGGKFILLSVLGRAYFQVAGINYHVLSLTKESIKDALISANLREIEIIHIDPTTQYIPCDGGPFVYVKAEKSLG